ncbi:hypothetical protein D3C87_1078680 [compost metagenome]
MLFSGIGLCRRHDGANLPKANGNEPGGHADAGEEYCSLSSRIPRLIHLSSHIDATELDRAYASAFFLAEEVLRHPLSHAVKKR